LTVCRLMDSPGFIDAFAFRRALGESAHAHYILVRDQITGGDGT
jgi:hypothetical protein